MSIVKKYDCNGVCFDSDDDAFIYAKESKRGRNSVQYLIRTEEGFFSDPSSMYVERTNDINLRKRLKPDYSYRVVSENVFNIYLHYLQTRKKVFLRQAEREHKSG